MVGIRSFPIWGPGLFSGVNSLLVSGRVSRFPWKFCGVPIFSLPKKPTKSYQPWRAVRSVSLSPQRVTLKVAHLAKGNRWCLEPSDLKIAVTLNKNNQKYQNQKLNITKSYNNGYWKNTSTHLWSLWWNLNVSLSKLLTPPKTNEWIPKMMGLGKGGSF